MDPRLLDYYEAELKYLRDQSRDFAESHQTAGRRLGLNTSEPDPYVERLLEGVAFLSSRVRLKLDDQFPEFTHQLLEAIQPHYLAPTPSICIAAFEPNEGDQGLAEGYIVPKRSQLTTHAPNKSRTQIIFETGHEVTLWPLKVTQAKYIHSRAEAAKFASMTKSRIQAAISIRLEPTKGIELNTIKADQLDFYLDGSEAIPNELYRQIIGESVGVIVTPIGGEKKQPIAIGKAEQLGFSEEESLLPPDGRTLGAYRMLSEYFACPERFRFARLRGLASAISQASEAIEITILLSRSSEILRQSVNESNFRLFVTPAINLFEKQMNRISYKPEEHNIKVVPDRSSRLDYEVFRLIDVKTFDQNKREPQTAKPLYAYGAGLYQHSTAVYYSKQVKMRTLSWPERRALGRDYYIGTDTFITLTCPGDADRLDDIKELSIRAFVTNRELPEDLKRSGQLDLSLTGVPASHIKIIAGPTRPLPPIGIGDSAWRVIGHLTPNYASFIPNKPGDAETLRNHLALYGRQNDSVMRAQIDGLMSIGQKPITRRVSGRGEFALARGMKIDIEMDDSIYDHASAFQFSAVVDRFLSEFCAVNSFTETRFYSNSTGEIAQWPPRIGRR